MKKVILSTICAVSLVFILVSCQVGGTPVSSDFAGNGFSLITLIEKETNSDKDETDKSSTSSRPPQDTHTHPTLLKTFEYVLVGQEYFVETTDFCKQLEDIEYTILLKEIAGIDFVYDKDTNEPKQSSSGVYIVGVKKGWERLKVSGTDKNGKHYTDVIDVKVLNESDLELL